MESTMSEEILKKLQATLLEIMTVIDSVCRKYQIPYSLYGGSLLGAVRHQGFIPWDDDLDICMSRENYNRFIEAWNQEKPEGYLLQNKENSPEFTQSFTKIRKEHTTFWQEGEPCDKYHTGIFVDVFPLDRKPDGKRRRRIFHKECIVYQVYTKGYISRWCNPKQRRISKVLLYGVPKGLHKYIRRFLLKRIVRHNKNKNNSYAAIETLGGIFSALPADIMDEYVELQFENRQFMCMKRWDYFLTAVFGNYMQLPPEDKRMAMHRPKIIDFERDYFEYTNYE